MNGADTPPSREDPLQALRSATAAQHEWLDSHVPLARPAPDARDYADHLRALTLWLQWMRLATDAAGWGGGYLDAARDDLREAGGEPPVAEALPLPDTSTAFCMGVAYVVEGSQLGGQVLYRRLAGPLAPLSLSYLKGRGADTGVHWKRFLETLRQAMAQPADTARACEGARWAFDTLIQHQRQAERASST